MEIKEFENFIKESRRAFRKIIRSNNAEKIVLIALFRTMLDQTSNAFEEETLKENLVEEYSDFLNDLIS